MDILLGLLRIRVKRGINLAIRDTRSSDPYVVVTLQNQRLKTKVVKDNCNPVWDDELTLPITDLAIPIHLSVYDKDTLTGDDKMGDAEFDLWPYVDAVRMRLENLPTPTTVSRVHPCRSNCLAEESCITWVNGKLVQDMVLRLRNVESGEVEIQIEWIDVPGSRGL
ncbi:hypothetical protein MLD38_004415 [Melastoma candidum]|uniref:Uncharacterized protein n=1 Tax=Melastoma candidum TaxID=119954 RepID=A0ACB9S5M5_9MYRT|nr:hypothetical protein MLD38_004415 [Melastoma candidum]